MTSRFDSGPYQGGTTITPGSAITKPIRAILATVAGNVNMTMADGTSVTVPVAANTLYPYMVTAVASSDTTATGLFGFY